MKGIKMAVSYEEETRNEKLVFIVNDNDAMEAFKLPREIGEHE